MAVVRGEPAQQDVEMRRDHRARVELDVGVAAQRVLPQQQQQHGRGEQRQGAVEVDGAELAALDAAGEHAADQMPCP